MAFTIFSGPKAQSCHEVSHLGRVGAKGEAQRVRSALFDAVWVVCLLPLFGLLNFLDIEVAAHERLVQALKAASRPNRENVRKR